MGLGVTEARRLFMYDAWANTRVLDAAKTLGARRFARKLESSFPSVADTIGHLLGAEWIWLQRWHGESPSAPPAWASGSSHEVLMQRLYEIHSARTEYLAGLGDEDLEQHVEYRTIAGASYSHRLKDMMLQVVNHSTHHRGQAVTLLRQLGVEGPGTDYVEFLRESE